jgi:iron complex transport system ATP-binding protein
MLIEIESVSVQRGSTRILNDINIRIPKREHVAIVGPNGSGKSTLLKLLMRFFYPSVVDGESGSVRILGRDTWNVWELRQHLGFISAEIDHHFITGRSGRLNALQSVLTGFFASELDPDDTAITDAMRDEASRLLTSFQMDSRSSKSIGVMSTGERRRCLLARAIVLRPQAIVLDEPTTGLDIAARAEFLKLLNQLAISGTQIILVTHHVEEILPCIERTILLKQGHVFQDDTTEAALNDRTLSTLFGTPIQIERDAMRFYHSRTK